MSLGDQNRIAIQYVASDGSEHTISHTLVGPTLTKVWDAPDSVRRWCGWSVVDQGFKTK
jgi:hypothetical protein